jgi:hypothetical protein
MEVGLRGLFGVGKSASSFPLEVMSRSDAHRIIPRVFLDGILFSGATGAEDQIWNVVGRSRARDRIQRTQSIGEIES